VKVVNRHLVATVLSLLIVILASATTFAHQERADGYYSFLDPKGQVIFQTALEVSIGDEFIAEDNSHYRVTRLEKDKAYCEYLGKISLRPQEEGSGPAAWFSVLFPFRTSPVSAVRNKAVAIYHTHSDESYVPSDGSASIYGQGGIFKVGRAMASRLKQLGLGVIHSTTSHDPHDAMAYTRSRRTVAELLRRRPAAIFDVHRDAVPREQYVATVKGENVTKVTLVVGRENPKIKANLNFAKQLKEINDRENPGLIKGIFLARGGYNQDLFDRALLIEVGTHENTREAAERGVKLFAESVPRALGVAGTPARTQPAPVTQRTGSWTALAWTLVLLIVGGAAYLYLSTGSWDELKRKIQRFEFMTLLGQKKK
jgi:stage II sporulation protein P